MAFSYRKRDPGSGGARRGAGRRPDFSPTLRKSIGEFCERTYRAHIARYHYGEWLASVVEVWDRRGSEGYWQTATMGNIRQRLPMTRPEFDAVRSLIYEPYLLFDEAGEVNFEIERMISTLETVVNTYMEIPIPVPQLRPLPRHLITETKQYVIYLAKLQLAPSGDVGDISDGIIKACWKYHLGLENSKEVHRLGVSRKTVHNAEQ